VLQPAIADYAVIGDCRSAALVSNGGSIDWLCLPQFDSPAMFASILDPDRGGRFQILPTHASTTTRRYVGESNVLETIFTTAAGVLRVTDLMPVDSEAGKAAELWPEHETFGICGFWEVECRVMQGDRASAVTQFERLLRYGNDVGLFAEETDPATGNALGNFPQGLTHVGLINAALSLREHEA